MRRLRRLSVHQFRSYGALSVRLDGRHVALTGQNGAGKTNLLEALSFLAPGRGMRRATLVDVLQSGGAEDAGWGVAADLQGPDEAEAVRLAMTAAPPSPYRKQLRVDGEPLASAGEIQDYIRFTWLTPAHDRLFADGPSERRRFLDRMTLAFDPTHAQSAARYEKAMRQRQAALAEGRPDMSLVGILERQMAEAGVATAAARRETVGRLAVGYDGLRSGAFPAAVLALEGWVETRLATMRAADVEDAFVEELAAGRRADLAAGRARTGPHRADLVVRHAPKDQLARQCSTGEQKALLIGLVLAHAAALKTQGGGDLVLLLDEIAAHLDEARRAALADILEDLGCQAVMTGTDRDLFRAWGRRAQHLTVADGTVEDGGEFDV